MFVPRRRRLGIVAVVVIGLLALAGCGAKPQQLSPRAAALSSSAAPSSTAPTLAPRPTPHPRQSVRASATSSAPARSTPSRATPVPTPTSAPSSSAPPPAPHHTTPPVQHAAPKLLPDRMADTRDSGQVVAVTNDGSGTDATLRAYQRSGGHWTQVFGPFAVKIGAGGFSHTVSEQTVASPIGYFTLTQAFGNDADPGTKLPYHHVAYGDVWVDQSSSPNYNTLQTGDADGTKGAGEKLWEVVPLYDYGAVIDYNRSPIQPGAGSAFFVHVTDGKPTAGCVSMPVGNLLPLLRWLDPAQSPRIAMGPEADVLGM